MPRRSSLARGLPLARILALALLVMAGPAQAHLAGVKIDDFWLGILHPLLTLENALAMLALGLLAGQAGEQTGLRVASCFALMLAAGAAIGMADVGGPWLTAINLGSLLLLGGLVALARPPPLPVMVGLSAVFGVSHGIANGLEIVAPIKPLLFIAGLTVGGFIATFYGMFIVLHLKPAWTRIGVRVVGSWIAAVGLLMIALSSVKTPAVIGAG